VTRCHHHAISVSVDGLLITPGETPDRVSAASETFFGISDGLDLTGSISPSLIGYCDCHGTFGRPYPGERSH
jgi:hypothetical protein